MCARAQKPERFFLLLHLSCIYVTCCFLSYRCLHLWGWILLLTSQMLYVAVQCHYVALVLLSFLLLFFSLRAVLAGLNLRRGELNLAEDKCQMARHVDGQRMETAVLLLANIAMAR